MEKSTQPEKYWAIVELFGHERMAGELTPVKFGDAVMFQIDVPGVEGGKECNEAPIEPFTQLINPKSIYRISPVSELIALAAVQNIRKKPVHVYNAKDDIRRILKSNPTLGPVWDEEE